MTNKTDNDMRELLEVLKNHPHLVHALVFDHRRVTRLLKSKGARRLARGVDARKTLLKRVAGAKRGSPVGVCLRGTVHMYKEEKFIDCLGGTNPNHL